MVILSFGGGAEGEQICNGLTVAETGIVSIPNHMIFNNTFNKTPPRYL